MLLEGLLGSWECIATLGCITLIPLLLTMPTFSAELFGTASLLQILYISAISGIIYTLIFKMYKKFSGKDFLDISEYIGGKGLKIIVGIFLIAYLFFEAFISLSEFTINVQNTLFHETPKEYIAILFTITVLIRKFNWASWNF